MSLTKKALLTQHLSHFEQQIRKSGVFTALTLSRLKEPSTWRGVVVLASGLGIALNPDQVAAISALA